ncbi:uncharacterized protein LOC117178883 [Belonocnema kinseyi]|uniref:uncharacterized protein LOC117178883 n=1 Tax=Belonocnema kinseyi TaxID=2817044 RepID=UPI00143DA680|nr:uncharacterized protein LOC117178883 [Belonocnema kinseyi]
MEKEQYRSVIRFLFLEGKTRSEIKDRFDAVYGDSSPSIATVKNWFNEFVRGHTSVFDEPRPGAPKTANTEENVNKIHDLVLADRRLKVRKIAEVVGIAEGTAHHILHEELGMRKLSARWVPRLLTPDNKRNRETTSATCIGPIQHRIEEKLRSAKKKVLFHHDNAPAHTSAVAVAELRYELLPHPPYSPDLTPCDFFCFQTWKSHSPGIGLGRMRSSPPRRPILQTLRKRIFWTG